MPHPLPRRTVLRTAVGLAVAAGLSPARAVFGSADKPRVRLGQIGTAHGHADKLAVYRQSPEYDVVGVVEPDDARWAAALDDPAYRGLKRMTEEELFNAPGLQAVTVETGIRELVPTGTRCAAAGLHVHLDKPAGTDLAAFGKLLELAESKRRMVQLGYMLRYSPATRLLKQLMKDGALGEVFEVAAVMSKVVGPADRKKLAEFPGGMMFELGCHVVDLVVGLLGRPAGVTAYPRTVGGDGLRDNMLAVFEYPKATATVRSTALEVDGGARRQLVVCGTGGTFRTEPLEPPTVRLTLAEAAGAFKQGRHEVPMPKYQRYVDDAADMAAVIRGEKPNDYPPAHDLLVHECVLRAAGMA